MKIVCNGIDWNRKSGLKFKSWQKNVYVGRSYSKNSALLLWCWRWQMGQRILCSSQNSSIRLLSFLTLLKCYLFRFAESIFGWHFCQYFWSRFPPLRSFRLYLFPFHCDNCETGFLFLFFHFSTNSEMNFFHFVQTMCWFKIHSK